MPRPNTPGRTRARDAAPRGTRESPRRTRSCGAAARREGTPAGRLREPRSERRYVRAATAPRALRQELKTREARPVRQPEDLATWRIGELARWRLRRWPPWSLRARAT